MRTLTFILLSSALTSCSNDRSSSIEATGTMESTDVTLSALVAGPVREVRVIEGDAVSAGDTLVLIDNLDWTLQLRQAEAALAVAEAQYSLVRLGSREEDVKQAEASHQSARRDLDRMKELHRSNSVSQKQLEDAELRYTLADQTLEKVRNGSRVEERIAAKARRDQAEAQAALLRKKVMDCSVVAPSSGTVLSRFVEPGEFANPGGALIRIADLTALEVKIYVPEADVPRIQLGQRAIIKVDAFPEREFTGNVTTISQTAEFTPKNIQTKDERTKLVFGVKVRVLNTDGVLKAGIPADVIL